MKTSVPFAAKLSASLSRLPAWCIWLLVSPVANETSDAALF